VLDSIERSADERYKLYLLRKMDEKTRKLARKNMQSVIQHFKGKCRKTHRVGVGKAGSRFWLGLDAEDIDAAREHSQVATCGGLRGSSTVCDFDATLDQLTQRSETSAWDEAIERASGTNGMGRVAQPFEQQPPALATTPEEEKAHAQEECQICLESYDAGEHEKMDCLICSFKMCRACVARTEGKCPSMCPQVPDGFKKAGEELDPVKQAKFQSDLEDVKRKRDAKYKDIEENEREYGRRLAAMSYERLEQLQREAAAWRRGVVDADRERTLLNRLAQLRAQMRADRQAAVQRAAAPQAAVQPAGVTVRCETREEKQARRARERLEKEARHARERLEHGGMTLSQAAVVNRAVRNGYMTRSEANALVRAAQARQQVFSF
jgi:hypothetical protein